MLSRFKKFTLTLASGAALYATGASAEDLKLTRKAPAAVPQTSVWSPVKMLNRAFNRDDLLAITAEYNLENCRIRNANRVIFSQMEKVNNGNCSEDHRYKKVEATAVARAALNRAAYRTANEFISTNEVLRTLVEGKFSLDFSFNDILEKVYVTKVPDARPEYVLEVVEKKVVAQSLHGDAQSGKATKEVVYVEKRIVERWPSIVANKRPEVTTVTAQDSLAERVSKEMGLAHVPFTRFRLRVEKTSAGLGTDVNFRFEERNEMMFADVTQYMKGNKDGVAWGLRVPYHKHSVGFEYANLKAEPVTFYRYFVNDWMNAKLSYQAEVNHYGAELNWLL